MLAIITSTGDGLFNFLNIDDLQRPRTLKLGVLADAAHILRVIRSSRSSTKPPRELGRGTPPPHSPFFRRLRRLVLGAYGVLPWVRVNLGGNLFHGFRGIEDSEE